MWCKKSYGQKIASHYCPKVESGVNYPKPNQTKPHYCQFIAQYIWFSAYSLVFNCLFVKCLFFDSSVLPSTYYIFSATPSYPLPILCGFFFFTKFHNICLLIAIFTPFLWGREGVARYKMHAYRSTVLSNLGTVQFYLRGRLAYS
jgi:hypothetical protein